MADPERVDTYMEIDCAETCEEVCSPDSAALNLVRNAILGTYLKGTELVTARASLHCGGARVMGGQAVCGMRGTVSFEGDEILPATAMVSRSADDFWGY